MEREVSKIIKDIKALKIQGARNIAKAVIKAIIIQTRKTKAKTTDDLYSELLVLSDALASTRPTEPMLRNSIKDVINFTVMEISKGKKPVKELKKEITKHAEDYLLKMEKDAQTLWEYGSRIIQEGNVVMTYCHSSTVTGILKEAHENGINFKVISCETRPKFQGRITSEELAKAGIDTTLIVDGAMNLFMRKADICIVGADAITSTGDLINKVGTSTLAHVARFHDVPFYCAAELYKYNPLTLYGNMEKIEERDPREVWDKAPKKLKVSNIAFDLTESRYISGYITEEGVISPQSFLSIVSTKLKNK